MKVTLEIEVGEKLSAADIKVLRAVTGDASDNAEAVAEAGTPAPAKKTAAKKTAAAPAAEPEESSLDRAVAAAQAAVAAQKKAEVKALLTEFGVSRVSELDEGDHESFIEQANALVEDDVV